MDWQPIETAPQDGRRVLLWAKQWEAPNTGQFYGEHWKIDGQLGPFAYPPTHWMPLPTPPKETLEP